MTHYEALSLASEVLKRARLDMQAGLPDAIAWLASTRATLWLDLFDIPQSTYLLRVGWPDHARVALTTLHPSSPQATCILTSLTYLDDLTSRSGRSGQLSN